MLFELSPEEERALVAALRPVFRYLTALERDLDFGYQGPVTALSLYPILIGAKPDGDALIADPSALLDGRPSLCWREWAKVDADDILAQSSAGPQRGGVKLIDIIGAARPGNRGALGGLLLELFRKAGGSK